MAPLREQALPQSDEEAPAVQPTPGPVSSASLSWRRAGGLALTFAACLACAALLLPGDDAPPAAATTARELLGSDHLADIMTDNIMKASRRPAASRAGLRRSVAEHLKDAQAAHEGLATVQLSSTEHAAVLRSMRRLGDADVQSVGKDLVEAARDTFASKGDREDLKRRLSERLQPRLPELRQLYLSVFPRELRRPDSAHDDERISSGVVAPEHLRVLRDFDAWKAAPGAHGPGASRKVDAAIAAQSDAVLTLLRSRFGDVAGAADARRLEQEQFAFKDEDGGNPRVYETAMECIMGEMTEAPTNVVDCVSTMLSNAMDSLTSMFDSDGQTTA